QDCLTLDDDALVEAADETTAVDRVSRGEDPTSPTMSLASRSDSAREVYRLFLASEYARALFVSEDLIAQGDHDPMLLAIARECRSSLPRPLSSAPPPSPLLRGIDGDTTLRELATMMGMSCDQFINVLDRFVTMGALTIRPPSR